MWHNFQLLPAVFPAQPSRTHSLRSTEDFPRACTHGFPFKSQRDIEVAINKLCEQSVLAAAGQAELKLCRQHPHPYHSIMCFEPCEARLN